MRFRAKFGALGWFWVGVALFYFLWLPFGPHRDNFAWRAIPPVFYALMMVLSKAIAYWDFNPTHLHERRLWRTRDVPWEEVIHIHARDPAHPSSGYLAVDYARTAPMSDRGTIIANPADRQGFIAALRRSAPQADCDV